jgi:hypothetical protein
VFLEIEPGESREDLAQRVEAARGNRPIMAMPAQCATVRGMGGTVRPLRSYGRMGKGQEMTAERLRNRLVKIDLIAHLALVF